MASIFLAYKYRNLFSPCPLHLPALAAPRSKSAMCVTLSLADEEKRTTEIDNPTTTDHQSDDMVRNHFISPSNWTGKKVADIPGLAHSGRDC